MERVDPAKRSSFWRSRPVGDCTAAFAMITVLMIHTSQSPGDDDPSSTACSVVPCPRRGVLVQTNGSQHPWLEERGPKLRLLVDVDDTTSTLA